jgi:uncharacterized damage-inducible protein DinB
VLPVSGTTGDASGYNRAREIVVSRKPNSDARMIDPAFCLLLARYNRWMNERLFATVAQFSDAQRKEDRGAFFGSMHRTLCHLVWADRIWLARFTETSYGAAAYGADLYDDFSELARERDAADTALLNWAGQVTPAWLSSRLRYTRKADNKTAELDGWVATAHLFNHATHHRGQVTTLIKQAGKDPGITDLPWMPGVTTIV